MTIFNHLFNSPARAIMEPQRKQTNRLRTVLRARATCARKILLIL